MALCALSPSLATASSRVCVKKEERAALPSQKPRRSRKREEREKREGCEGAMTIDDEFDVFFSRSTCPLSQKSEREAVPMPLDDGTDAGAGGGGGEEGRRRDERGLSSSCEVMLSTNAALSSECKKAEREY